MTELVIAGPAAVEAAADPANYVVVACERAKAWLAQALDHGDIEQIVELKSQAEAIRVYTMQKQLGKDAELSAAEIVRRAERGIGVAIRKGQQAGEIAKSGDIGAAVRPGHSGGGIPGKKRNSHLVRPADAAMVNHPTELGPLYAMAASSDDQFDAVIQAARAEGNLTRANVVRKVKRARTPDLEGNTRDAVTARRERIRELAEAAWSSRQIAADLGITAGGVRQIAREIGLEIPADQIIGRTRQHDPVRIISETVTALEGLCMGLGLLDADDYAALDPHDVKDWSSSLAKSLRSLNQLKKELNHG